MPGVKTFMLIVVGLVVAVVVAVLVVPSLIDWNAYKAEIEAEAEKATGRKLTIGGDIRAAILPAPVLRVEDVQVANTPNGRAAYFASLSSLEVRVALGPLLGGQIQVQTVRLVDPVVNLEMSADGGNWTFGPGEQSADGDVVADSNVNVADASGAEAGGGVVAGVRLDNFTIENGTLVYYDAVAGTEERVSDINAAIRAASLSGPFDVKGSFVARALPLHIDTTVGQIVHGRTVSVRTDIGIGDDASLSASGTLTGLSDELKFRGQVSAESGDLADLIARIGGGVRQPALAKPFSAGAEVSAGPTSIAATNIRIGLGDESLNGSMTAELGDTIQFAVDLAAGRIDGDAIAALEPAPSQTTGDGDTVGATSGETASVATPVPAAPEASGGPVIPANLQGSVALSVDAIVYNGQKVGPVRLNAEVANGEVTLSQFQTSVPGGGDIAVFGFITIPDGKPLFDGEVEAKIADLRATAAWLNVQVPDVDRERLRTLTYKSRVIATPEQVQLAGMTLGLDTSTLIGGVTIALRSRPAFGADLSVDTLNADAYLPRGSGNTAANDAAGTGGGGSAGGSGEIGGASAGASSPFAALRFLDTFDANLKARIGLLTYNGTPIRDARIDATLFKGDLTLRNFSVAEAAGAGLAVTGTVSELSGLPKAKDLSIAFAAADLAPVMALAGQTSPPIVANLGAVKLDATLNGALSAPVFATTLSAGGMDIRAQGTAKVLDPQPGVDAAVRFRHPNLNRLVQILGLAYRPSGALGAVDVATTLKATLAETDLGKIKGRVGGTSVSGTANARYDTPKPILQADLQTGVLIIDPFMPAEQSAGVWPETSPVGTPAGPIRRKVLSVSPRWPDDPIDLSALGAMDGQVTLMSEALVYGPYRFEQADIIAKLTDGVLAAEKINGRLFGGQLATTANVNSRTGAINATINLAGAGIASALQAVTGDAIATGGIDFTTQLSTVGHSVADFVAALNGSGSIGLSRVDPKGAGTGSALAPMIGLVSGLAQLNSALSLQGDQRTSSLADVSATFTIQNGVARTNDLGIASALGRGEATGAVDLAGWGVSLDGQLQLAQSVLTQILTKSDQAQTVPFSVSGALDAPNVKVDTASLASGGLRIVPGIDKLLEKQPAVGTILQGILGGGKQQQPQTNSGTQTAPPSQDGSSGNQPPAQQPAQQQPVTPEKAIKGLLDGLLGN